MKLTTLITHLPLLLIVSLAWCATPPTMISVQDAGAKGDGVTDDTAAITAARLSFPPQGGTLYFPPGKYKISGAGLDFYGRSELVYFVGAGSGNESNGNAATTILYTGTQTAFRAGKVHLNGMRFETSTGATGVWLSACNDSCVVDDLVITGFSGHGFHLDNSFDDAISNVRALNNGVGFYLNGNRINLTGSHATGNRVAGLQFQNCVLVNLIGNTIEFNNGPAITPVGQASKSVRIVGNYFEGNGHMGNPSADIEFPPGIPCRRCTISENYFQPAGSATINDHALYVAGCIGCVFETNHYEWGYHKVNARFAASSWCYGNAYRSYGILNDAIPAEVEDDYALVVKELATAWSITSSYGSKGDTNLQALTVNGSATVGGTSTSGEVIVTNHKSLRGISYACIDGQGKLIASSSQCVAQ